jgi:hypothetical protein
MSSSPKGPKTQPTTASVADFIDAVPDPTRQADARVVGLMMQTATGEPPVIWGSNIVGFGAYQSNSGAWPVIAFSPRKTELVLYVMPGFSRYDELMARLGKCRTGASCLYIKRLSDVDTSVLQELVQSAVTAMEPKRIR